MSEQILFSRIYKFEKNTIEQGISPLWASCESTSQIQKIIEYFLTVPMVSKD